MRRYSLTAIVLHWTIAALLAFQISVGWALEDLGARGFALFQLHKSVGITILILTLLRLVVRYLRPRPERVEGGWQGAIASAVHGGLYAFMLAAPLTGWALVSTAKVKVPTLLFGIVPLPHLPLPAASHGLAAGAHGLLAWIGIALLALHVAGALRHHLLLRDGLLWRMMPTRSPLWLLLLPALILLGAAVGRAILPPPAPAHRTAPSPEPVPVPVPAKDAPAAAADPAPAAKAVADATENAAGAEPAALPPPPAWTVQPGGHLRFSVDNGGQAISGGFARWSAKIVMDPDHPGSADIRVEIDLASASVGDAYQDGMLAGDEFFGVAAHPRAIFTASGATKSGNGYRATGTLSLKGVSRPQTIRFTLSGSGARRKVAGSASIARQAFGVGTGESAAGLAPRVAVSFDFAAKAE
ncbi:cytochrome b/b6 domain-containing protein [Sphingobium mellinum]|uniref:cytochrome b/b6 domain-containing protein n=1 Tax=Sphingobium mellinum TaxID=1387166 RepID=UPI0030ED3A51